MIQLVASVAADFLAVGWSGVEHQQSRPGSMSRKNIKHAALVIWLEMKKTVPRKHAVERPVQRQ
jgi:hypothetical protein